MKRALFLLAVFFSFGCAESHLFRYDVSICAIFRNEAPYLKEWIEFHRLVGVEHFYLINHISEDDYLSVLQPYIDQGIVSLDNCNEVTVLEWDWLCLQRRMYLKTIEQVKYKTNWLAVIDVDEFLFPVRGNNLGKFLKDYERYVGLLVNWQLYGTSDVECIQEDELLIEKLIRKAPEDYVDNMMLKSIVILIVNENLNLQKLLLTV